MQNDADKKEDGRENFPPANALVRTILIGQDLKRRENSLALPSKRGLIDDFQVVSI